MEKENILTVRSKIDLKKIMQLQIPSIQKQNQTDVPFSYKNITYSPKFHFVSQNNFNSHHIQTHKKSKSQQTIDRMRFQTKSIFMKKDDKRYFLQSLWKLYGKILELDRLKLEQNFDFDSIQMKKKRLYQQLLHKNKMNKQIIHKYIKKGFDETKIDSNIKQNHHFSPSFQKQIFIQSPEIKPESILHKKFQSIKIASKICRQEDTVKLRCSTKPLQSKIRKPFMSEKLLKKQTTKRIEVLQDGNKNKINILKSVCFDGQLSQLCITYKKRAMIQKTNFLRKMQRKKTSIIVLKQKYLGDTIDSTTNCFMTIL